MVSNDLIQKVLIAALKADVTLVNMLTDAASIKESQWQGRTFNYPAVRVSVTLQVPLLTMAQCVWSRVSFSVFTMSEQDSSKQADVVAGRVDAVLHKKQFPGTGFRLWFIRSAGLASATRMSERVWRSEAAFIADLYTT